jgi:hypothetical protein
MPQTPRPAAPVDIDGNASVAGEEDPGAALDTMGWPWSEGAWTSSSTDSALQPAQQPQDQHDE